MISEHCHTIPTDHGTILLGFRVGEETDGVVQCQPCFAVIRKDGDRQPILLAHLRAWLGEQTWNQHMNEASEALTQLHGRRHLVVPPPELQGALHMH